ncbi:MAG TPA: hypothetical protein VFQ42_22000 [Mycobacterium sp.]|nr:hypothetical protein [Mycobacterium sp.]
MSKLPRLEPLGRIDYSSSIPPLGYHCGKCGVHGVKLWREYNTFLDRQSLLCCDCACAEQSQDGKRRSVHQLDDGRPRCTTIGDAWGTDQIGWRIPAVPTADGETYWGYSSVPDDGCQWLYRLPLRRLP